MQIAETMVHAKIYIFTLDSSATDTNREAVKCQSLLGH